MQKMEKRKNPAADFLKVLFVMYIITMLLLVLLAFLFSRLEIAPTFFNVWLIAVYVVSGFIGGFIIGKRVGKKKFLWGFAVGAVYFGILFVVSLILHKGVTEDVMHLLTTAVLCLASSTVGGMVS